MEGTVSMPKVPRGGGSRGSKPDEMGFDDRTLLVLSMALKPRLKLGGIKQTGSTKGNKGKAEAPEETWETLWDEGAKSTLSTHAEQFSLWFDQILNHIVGADCRMSNPVHGSQSERTSKSLHDKTFQQPHSIPSSDKKHHLQLVAANEISQREMKRGQPYQQPDFDYSHVRSAFPPTNDSYLPHTQFSQPVNPGSWPEAADDAQQNAAQGAASTTRAPPGTEHTKHRRTRSGCFTCRQRRVKPKINAKSSSSKSAAAKSKAPIPEESGSEREDDIKKESPVPEGVRRGMVDGPISKAGRKQPRTKLTAARKQQTQGHKQALPSIEHSEHDAHVAQSPQTDASSPSQSGSRSSRHLDNVTPESSISPEKISLSQLPHRQRYYLEYLRNNLTYHHYFFRGDANYFIRHVLIESALSYEPLLQAVVGFAAFQATLNKPDGKIQDFLCYYNESVSLLLKSLTRGQKHTEAMLLTILQLATIEEYLGDWVNLLGHQKAAYSMLTELYTVETIMESELSRKILSWYSRFDLFAGFLSGSGVMLGREWFVANGQYHAEQLMLNPESIHCRLEVAVAEHRTIALDMAILFAKLPRGAITIEEFRKENEKLEGRINGWREGLEPLMSDDRYMVESFEGAPERPKDDIVDPYRPGGLMQGPLWTMNFLMMDWCGTKIMHTYQTALIMQEQPHAGLSDLALDMCRLFEAVEYWPGSAPGSILAAQAGLGIAVIFIPQDERHTMWCRRKLAKIESQGYTYPPTFRAKMANLWGVPGVHHWWLPNEEGYPPIVRSIRSFIQDRSQKSSDQPLTENVRTMKGLFDKLNID
ncbi:MAG: hypothetical protein LQ350_002209 [Teloschistes chrysophthalmus]|nr:MAG: hypothetical protein LQ350_002209 [Niorma chrysophthalma]